MKITIPKEQLPSLLAGQTDCFIRYRLISQDRNRLSAWTPVFNATPTVPFTDLIGGIQADITTLQGDVVNLYNISDDNFLLSVVL
jgi:hypothetical protein